jgi:hypothetical protein
MSIDKQDRQGVDDFKSKKYKHSRNEPGKGMKILNAYTEEYDEEAFEIDEVEHTNTNT